MEHYTIAELLGDMLLGGAPENEIAEVKRFANGETSKDDFHDMMIELIAKYRTHKTKTLAVFPKNSYKNIRERAVV